MVSAMLTSSRTKGLVASLASLSFGHYQAGALHHSIKPWLPFIVFLSVLTHLEYVFPIDFGRVVETRVTLHSACSKKRFHFPICSA